MYELGVVYRNIQRADATTAHDLGRLGSATVHEAQGRVGLMQTYMRPIYERTPASMISARAPRAWNDVASRSPK